MNKTTQEALQAEQGAWNAHNDGPTAATAEALQAATVAKWAALVAAVLAMKETT